MNFNEKLSDELTGLVVLSLESGLNEESKQRLEELLEREPLARKHLLSCNNYQKVNWNLINWHSEQ